MSKSFSIVAEHLNKKYVLYPNKKAQALDLLGYYKIFSRNAELFPTFSALKDVNFSIEQGGKYGIIGRNGSGKSTLFKLIIGCLVPSSGGLSVNGQISALMNIGLGFHPELTGRENIQSALLYNQLNQLETRMACEEIIEFCELKEFIDQPLRTYSLGMRARLQFACATAIKPDILVIDEVLSAGDAYFAEKTANRVYHLSQGGCTLLLTSHSDAQILQFCERVIWLDQGTVQSIGPAAEIVAHYQKFIRGLSSEVSRDDLIQTTVPSSV